MGMSADWRIAIEEGSTCVRVGTAIFGARRHAGEPTGLTRASDRPELQPPGVVHRRP